MKDHCAPHLLHELVDDRKAETRTRLGRLAALEPHAISVHIGFQGAGYFIGDGDTALCAKANPDRRIVITITCRVFQNVVEGYGKRIRIDGAR